jgi:Rha family phage regulatory protein
MKELVFAQGGKTLTSSRLIAEYFGKEHKNVLRDIENLGCSEEFGRLNFEPTSYRDFWGREQKQYVITRDGFTLLVMGFTGENAMKFKEDYIAAFNEMEAKLRKQTPVDYTGQYRMPLPGRVDVAGLRREITAIALSDQRVSRRQRRVYRKMMAVLDLFAEGGGR